MFRKILVAIDGSEPANRAFEEAIGEAGVWDAEVHVVYVVESGLFSIPSHGQHTRNNLQCFAEGRRGNS